MEKNQEKIWKIMINGGMQIEEKQDMKTDKENG